MSCEPEPCLSTSLSLCSPHFAPSCVGLSSALFLLTTPSWFLHHSVGKKILETLTTNPFHLHSPPGAQLYSDWHQGEHQASLFTAQQKSGKLAGPCSWKGFYLWSTPRVQIIGADVPVEHGSFDPCPPPSTPTRHLQSVLGKTGEPWARLLQGKQRWIVRKIRNIRGVKMLASTWPNLRGLSGERPKLGSKEHCLVGIELWFLGRVNVHRISKLSRLEGEGCRLDPEPPQKRG